MWNSLTVHCLQFLMWRFKTKKFFKFSILDQGRDMVTNLQFTRNKIAFEVTSVVLDVEFVYRTLQEDGI